MFRRRTYAAYRCSASISSAAASTYTSTISSGMSSAGTLGKIVITVA